MSLPIEIAALGAITGLTYGLLAVGLVLVYRSSRFINFAHGEIGVFAAASFALVVDRFGVPYWVAFPLAVIVGAGVGAGTETVLVSRLAKAPRLLSMIATLVLAQFLLVFALVVNGTGLSGTVFPKPAGVPGDVVWGAVFVSKAHVAMLVLTPLVVGGLLVFFRRSRFGMAIRAAAANPDAAALAGMSPTAMATMTWAIAGALSAFTAVLVIPTRGLAIGFALGPSLLLPGLAAAVIGRLRNLGTPLPPRS
jgi:branched-subunit amino acid ABC-type transport system permease component